MISCGAFSPGAWGQSSYRIEKYDSQNGLGHHWVQGVQQDKQGFIWLALKEGMIARFDGRTFRHFPMSEAEKKRFGSNNIFGLMIDEQDSIFVVINHRLASFDRESGRFSPVELKSLGYADINAFWEAKWQRNTWTKNWRKLKNPARLVRQSGETDTLLLRTSEEVYEVLETGSEYWVATFDGLLKFSPCKRLFDTYYARPFNLQEGLVTGRSIYGISASKGRLFFIEKGLWRAPIQQPEQAEIYVNGSLLNGFFGLTTDRDGWLWAGRSEAPTLLRIHPEDTSKHQEFPLPEKFHTHKRSFLALPDGRVAAACGGGLLLIDPDQGTVKPFETDKVTNAWSLHFSQNTLWAGTETGLWRLELNGDSFQAMEHFNTDNSPGFRSNKIISIHEAAGFLWLGSDGGLIRLSLENMAEARTFTTAEGLPHNKVYFAIPDGNYLWCGTDWGLSRITLNTALKTNELPEVRNFHVDDGLPHEEFNSLSFFKSPANGKIYLGGLNGITVFSQKDLDLPLPANPPLVFVELEKYDNKHDTTLVLDLTGFSAAGASKEDPGFLQFLHFEQNFTFRFALLSYANPNRNSYQYLMEGLEKKWNAISNENFARYTSLPPGKYTFRVRAADHNGNWTRQEIALPIIVKRAWYAAPWAWGVYLLVTSTFIWFFYKQRLQQVRLSAKAQHLEELDDFKNRFFTNITHEFRTPLTVILGMTERWMDDGARWTVAEAKQKAGLIKRNAESLLRLINQILDLAKLKDKSLQLNQIQGDILPYIRYITESLHSTANTRNLLLQMESTEAQIIMDYDPERFLSIVHNLLSNAMKFTPSGGKIELRTRIAGDRRTNPFLMLEVEDNGIGIPAAALPKIFDQFYQVQSNEGADTRLQVHLPNTGGTGIGLSLTRELVKVMGGDISVESRTGQGAVFRIRLPIFNKAPFSDPLSGGNAAGLHVSTKGGILKSSLFQPGLQDTILLIEDSPDVVEYLTACLGESYRLKFAYNGRAGIETALETIPDLIISDVMMPEKDGFEVCNTLKNDERSSHIPIILLTAKANIESRIAGLQRGADAYLAKPFHQEELLATVANLLETRRKLQERYRQSATSIPKDDIQNLKPEIEDAFLQKLHAVVEPRLGSSDLSVDEVGKKLGMSRSVLYAKLSALTGLSFNIYLRSLRLRKAQELLLHSSKNVSEIAYEVGFNDPRYFIRVFSEEFGKPPGEWRASKQQ